MIALSLVATPRLRAADAIQIPVTRHTLANGMTVLIHEDHDVPNVAMYFFFKVGSRNEKPGTTGLSHFFEHMMFNGAKKYGPKQFDIQMENAGGRNNGYTTRDITVYQDWFPRTALDLMFDMEADRIRDLAFDPKLIESERGVVYSERRLSVDNNPFGALNEQLWATAFLAHNYAWSPIGWPSDIESWTLDDLKNYWSMGYAPNNCVMVIAGDVTQAEAIGLAKKHLEGIPRREPPPALRTKEPAQAGERRVNVERPAQLPVVMIGYHIPESRHADTPAIEILNAILTQGRSSRLSQRLVEKDQLALAAQASVGESLDPGLWTFFLRPRSGVDPAKAEAALYEQLARIGRDGVTAAELTAAQSRILANFYRGLKTIAGKANLIGASEIYLGDATRLGEQIAGYEKVTADDVRRVAAAYLKPANRTVASLIPVLEGK
jgi:zinc protease